MHASPDAEQYAKALIALGEASGCLDVLQRELPELVALVRRSEPLQRFLADRRVRPEGKTAALSELLESEIHPALLHFLLTLQALGAVPRLEAIETAFFTQLAGRQGEATGKLVAAQPLPPAKVRAIEAEVGRILGRPVALRLQVNPDIVGGLWLSVENLILDGTVTRQLDRIRAQLLAG